MKSNMGLADRIIRMFVAFVILFVIAMGFARPWTAVTIGGLGAYLGLTAVAGHCPLYGLFAINTDGRT